MDCVTLRERPRQFPTLTSMRVAEFDELLAGFVPAWKRRHPLNGVRRQRLAQPVLVVMEYAHSGFKRPRLVADALRPREEWPRDAVMVVACGLHNLLVHNSRPRAFLL